MPKAENNHALTKIFVYGTLMDGECNHHLLQNLPYRAAYAENLVLHNLGSYPAAAGGEGTVYGEVYEVDRETLRKLDELESSPELYHRETIRVYYSAEESDTAEIYILPEAVHCPGIPSGRWRERSGNI